MTASLVPYAFDDSLVRVRTDHEGNPWFVAKDVCNVLDLGNPSQAVSELEDDEKNTISIADGNRGNPNMLIISESGLYSLVFRSRKPEARRVIGHRRKIRPMFPKSMASVYSTSRTFGSSNSTWESRSMTVPRKFGRRYSSVDHLAKQEVQS